MGICTPDMRKCDIKKRCLFGPNEGKAYDPKNPCCGVGEFDPGTCDCIVTYARFVGTRITPDGFAPVETDWVFLNGGSLTIYASGVPSCEEAGSETFCGDPLDLTPWNDEAKVERGDVACSGNGGFILFSALDVDGNATGTTVTLFQGLDCAYPVGSEAIVTGEYEFVSNI